MTTLSGHFARFGEWAEIDSRHEGNFLERIAPGAFRKTMAENRNRIRVLLSHGSDPQLGNKPLGTLEELREDEQGGYYSAPLLDGVPELVVSGLRAGLYGASFRFSTMREDFTQRPGKSDSNPRGLPERTLREVRLHELGPTPFPAYAGATAGLRSAAGAELELRAYGREEVLPDDLVAGSAPVTIRRLRADGSPHARTLLRALEYGEGVEITWGARGRSLGRVVSQRSSRETDWFIKLLER